MIGALYIYYIFIINLGRHSATTFSQQQLQQQEITNLESTRLRNEIMLSILFRPIKTRVTLSFVVPFSTQNNKNAIRYTALSLHKRIM